MLEMERSNSTYFCAHENKPFAVEPRHFFCPKSTHAESFENKICLFSFSVGQPCVPYHYHIIAFILSTVAVTHLHGAEPRSMTEKICETNDAQIVAPILTLFCVMIFEGFICRRN
jgi:hypothetical protein